MFKKLCSSIATPPPTTTTARSSSGGGGAVSSQKLTRESTKKPPLLAANPAAIKAEKAPAEVFDPNPNNVSIHPKTPIRNFELGPIIGTGSFGIVPIAKHRDSGLVVAIKILSKAHVAKTVSYTHLTLPTKA